MLAPSLIKHLAEAVATTVKGPERDVVRGYIHSVWAMRMSSATPLRSQIPS